MTEQIDTRTAVVIVHRKDEEYITTIVDQAHVEDTQDELYIWSKKRAAFVSGVKAPEADLSMALSLGRLANRVMELEEQNQRLKHALVKSRKEANSLRDVVIAS